MSTPVDIDAYCRYLPMSDDELMEVKGFNPSILPRLHRLRAAYSYWLSYPTKLDTEIVQYLMAIDTGGKKISKIQAYDDLRILQNIIGNMQRASRDFWRFRINSELDADIRRARAAGDFRSVAALHKVRVQNNRTDKDNEVEMEYDKIPVMQIVWTGDPAVLGIEGAKSEEETRKLYRKLDKKYRKQEIQDAEFEEIDDGNG